jgi:hypothetical protein
MPSSASAETLPGGGQGAKQSCAPRRTPKGRSVGNSVRFLPKGYLVGLILGRDAVLGIRLLKPPGRWAEGPTKRRSSERDYLCSW